jgi:N-acetylglutamate synthase-like GNAT family acetyltransferase
MSIANETTAPPQLLLEEWSARLETREGVRLNVRPASPDDEQALMDFFAKVSPEDLRFRFLSGVPKVGESLVHDLVSIDHTTTENFLAFDEDDRLVATAMVAAESDLSRAEVAIAVRVDCKHHGVGWTLLSYVSDYATARGIRRLESIECRDNREAIALEREMGFTAAAYPGDPTLTLVTKDLVAKSERT